MKINIWRIVLLLVNFTIVSALFLPKVSYNKVSFIKRGEPEYIETEDSYNEKNEYVNVTYSKIIDSMLSLSKLNQETTSLIKLGKSCGLLDISALTIQKSNYNPKFGNTILLVAGVQEDDWQSVFTAFYIAKQLTEHNESAKIMFGINTKWVIVPILNPDLYTNSFENGNVAENVSKCFKNTNWYNNSYGQILDEVKQENITTIIHLNSEKVCTTNYSNYLRHNELNTNENNRRNKLAQVLQNENSLICNVNIQELNVTKANISANESFEEWIFKNANEFQSVIVLSVTILKTVPPNHQYISNLVELKTVLRTVQIIKKIKVFFSQTYYIIVDNWPNEIDNFLHRRFPHERSYYGIGAKIKICQILLPLQLFILYVLNKIKF